ncbi:hypothetical protein HID58_066096 [Brassica napus]|uniref:tryptophan synthase n=1 Tax=Brassica napus TaxID=3708 RepID=A0ABQ7ZEQ1_BRANA|nr:hypothetical protein HID58_066096 [Brassica napus]
MGWSSSDVRVRLSSSFFNIKTQICFSYLSYSLMSFSVKVSWAPRSRVLLLTPSRTVLMPLHLCLRHCVSNYSACVSSFMFWESRNTRNAVISWASTCSSSIISLDLLAKRLGKKGIIAETGAGQHGVANSHCVCPVWSGVYYLYGCSRHGEASPQCLQNATSWCRGERSSLWNSHIEGRDIRSDKRLGSVAGPHPYPMMVRDFHAVIGKETRRQALEKWGGKPDVLVACVGGGSNAMGLFHEFVDDAEVRMIGVEAAGFGLDSGKHAAPLTKGDVGVLHGAMSYLLQDDDGQIIEPQCRVRANQNMPNHKFADSLEGLYQYVVSVFFIKVKTCSLTRRFVAFNRVSRLEGIISALETSHALAHLEKLCPTLPDGARVVLNFSGRGDKDDQTVAKYLEV